MIVLATEPDPGQNPLHDDDFKRMTGQSFRRDSSLGRVDARFLSRNAVGGLLVTTGSQVIPLSEEMTWLFFGAVNVLPETPADPCLMHNQDPTVAGAGAQLYLDTASGHQDLVFSYRGAVDGTEQTATYAHSASLVDSTFKLFWATYSGGSITVGIGDPAEGTNTTQAGLQEARQSEPDSRLAFFGAFDIANRDLGIQRGQAAVLNTALDPDDIGRIARSGDFTLLQNSPLRANIVELLYALGKDGDPASRDNIFFLKGRPQLDNSDTGGEKVDINDFTLSD
jgi:hypothetical protein